MKTTNTKCGNCSSELRGAYCSACGRPVQVKRINGSYIKHELAHLLHLEKGILFTIKELLIRPGKSVQEFIHYNRYRLVKPILFIIVTSLIYTLANTYFNFEDGYVKQEGLENSTIGKIFIWVQAHYGYANIVMGLFIAFWTKLFFRKYDYNFFEILILLCYVMGIGMLLLALFGILESFTIKGVASIGAILVFVYMTWSIGQFFENKLASYLKALLAYLLGYAAFLIVVVVLGLAIDIIF